MPNATSEILDRRPPSDPELEKRVIGMLLVIPKSLERMACLLKPRHFYDSRARAIYKHFLDLWDEGKGPLPDISLLLNRIRENGKDDEFRQRDGPAYLAMAMYENGLESHLEYYATVLLEHAKRRAVIRAATRILVDAYSDMPLDEFMERAREHWRRVSRG